MTFPSPRLATVGLRAAGCLGLVAACGDEDDGGGSSDKLTASCKAHAAVTEGFNKFFTQTPALMGDGPPPKSATPQIRKNYDKKVRDGDFSAVMSKKFEAQTERIDGYFFGKCDDERVRWRVPTSPSRTSTTPSRSGSGAIDSVNPGKFGYTSATLTLGEYIAVCFLPKGSQPGVEGKGKPHFQLGMKEFKVD